jgi:CHAT domain-containing protein
LAAGEYEIAYEKAQQAMELERGTDGLGFIRSEGIKGMVLIKKRDFKGAHDIFTNVLAQASENGLKEEEQTTLLNLSEVSRQSGELMESSQFRIAASKVKIFPDDPGIRSRGISVAAESQQIRGQIRDLSNAKTPAEQAELVAARLDLIELASPQTPDSSDLESACVQAETLPESLSWLKRRAWEMLAMKCEAGQRWGGAATNWFKIFRQFNHDQLENDEVHSEIRVQDSGVFSHLARCLALADRVSDGLDYAELGKSWRLDRYLGPVPATNNLSTSEQAEYLAKRKIMGKLINERYTMLRTNPYAEGIGAVDAEITRLDTGLSQLAGISIHVASGGSNFTGGSNMVAELWRRLGRPIPLIEYVLSESNLVSFCVYQDQHGTGFYVTNQIISQTLLSSLADSQWEKADSHLPERAQRNNARILYDILIAPLKPWLPADQPVAIVPDGILWKVSFAALMDEQGEYFLRHHPPFLIPSIRTLASLVARRDAGSQLASLGGVGPDVLVVANPSVVSNSMPAIPGTQRQAEMLAAILTNRVRVLTGAAATRENILQEIGHYRWLHFAMHGEYDDDNPLLCGLRVAAPANLTDGDGSDFFGCGDLINQKLNAEMVVLSSCNSTKGRIQPGEGLVGLTWGFLAAGSSCCIGSQWEVVDSSTPCLMTNFYSRLTAPAIVPGQKTDWKVESLAKAQTEFMIQQLTVNGPWQQPRYWAPFVLIGDPR